MITCIEKLRSLTGSRWYFPVVLALLFLFSAMRLAHIEGDPPPDLSMSAALYTDEGFKTYGSRCFALFGNKVWAQGDLYVQWDSRSPVPYRLYREVFTRLGVGFFSIRLVSVVYAILSMIILFIFTLRTYDRLTALLAHIFFGISYFIIMHNRLGLYETHVVFYSLLALFGFSEMCRPGNGRSRFLSGLLLRVLGLTLGVLGIMGAVGTKSSVFLVFFSLCPAFLLYGTWKISGSQKTTGKLLLTIFIIMASSYLILGQGNLVAWTLEMFSKIPGLKEIPEYFSLKRDHFATIPFALATGVYIEFVYLQPFLFGVSFLYGLYLIYRLIHGAPPRFSDLLMASWLVFGFLLLSLMTYHPARYYLLFSPPLVILAARAIADTDGGFLAFVAGRESRLFTFLVRVFWSFAIVYVSVVIAVLLVPFSTRNALLEYVYYNYMLGDIVPGLQVTLPTALGALAIMALLVYYRKKIVGRLTGKNALPALFLCIVLLQGGQYAGWLFGHTHALPEISRELGKTLPKNAVITGCWSAGLVVENQLRALVVQMTNNPNHHLIEKILRNEELVTYHIRDGKPVELREKNIPLYLVVCPGVAFERDIVKRYHHLMTKKRMVRTMSFSWFNVEVYRLR